MIGFGELHLVPADVFVRRQQDIIFHTVQAVCDKSRPADVMEILAGSSSGQIGRHFPDCLLPHAAD
jgi:hypothetical protein